MKDLNLPEPLAAYFDADQRGGKAVARCFTSNGRVVDEGQTHVGLAAIEAWKSAASGKYSYTAEPFALARENRTYIVTSRVTGDFPSSPVDLRYAFTLERGKISTLEISP